MAYQRRNEKNGWALFLLILAGIVLGGFLGNLASGVSFLKWLDFGYQFGMTGEPVVIDLKVMILTFRLLFNITLSSLLGIVLAVFIYRKI